MKQAQNKTILCPSSKCEEGALLLGIVNGNGQINLLTEKKIIDKKFVQIAESGRDPHTRFRFGNKCHKSGCSQWTGERCGVIDKLMDITKDLKLAELLPECAIRPQCRWYDQSGAEACKICPYVITNAMEETGSIPAH